MAIFKVIRFLIVTFGLTLETNNNKLGDLQGGGEAQFVTE